MTFTNKSFRSIYIAISIVLLLGLITPAQVTKAAALTIYDATPDPLPPSMPSLGFQATQTAELGDHILLGGTDRALREVTVTMVTWAYHSTWAAMPVSGWTHPITLNLYNVDTSNSGYPGTLIATRTQPFDIPWRPEPDTTGACSGTTWLAPNGSCNNGYAFNITFDMSSLNVVLPDEVIVGISYNTQTGGYVPIGTSGPYNSLNIGVRGSTTIGTDYNTNNLYWNTQNASFYDDGGTAGSGIFREDTNWAPNGTIPIQIIADTIPTVTASSLQATYTNTGPSTFTVNFSEDVNNAGGGAGANDVTNPNNYLLIEKGTNGVVDTVSCAGGVVADDKKISISNVTYANPTAIVSLASTLPAGNYRIFVCGTTSIENLGGIELNGGLSDFTFDFVVIDQTSGATTQAARDNTVSSTLPATGFAPNRITTLPPQPADLAYPKLGDIWLEIPKLNVKSTIVGVPQNKDKTWDVTWLGNDTGWLNGTAFPTWTGNSVLTAHVTNASGLEGPFAALKQVKYSDQIIVHMGGAQYIYEVRTSRLARPYSTSYAFESLQDHSYLTLITCQGYNPLTDTYLFRRVIRAVLVSVVNK